MTEYIFGPLYGLDGLDLVFALIAIMTVLWGFDSLKSHIKRKRRKELMEWLRNGKTR